VWCDSSLRSRLISERMTLHNERFETLIKTFNLRILMYFQCVLLRIKMLTDQAETICPVLILCKLTNLCTTESAC